METFKKFKCNHCGEIIEKPLEVSDTYDLEGNHFEVITCPHCYNDNLKLTD